MMSKNDRVSTELSANAAEGHELSPPALRVERDEPRTSMRTKWRLAVAAALVMSAAAPFVGCAGGDSPGESDTKSTSQALVSDGIVISQVYGGGGNSNATYERDYVELFNRSGVDQSLDGLSLQYGSENGNFGTSAANIFALPNVTVRPGQYFLVALAFGGPQDGAPIPGDPLPAAFDVEGSIALGATNGKVALARTTSPLGCGAAANRCTANVVDMVGFGTSTSDFEGTSLGGLGNNKAAVRMGGGCKETDTNNADFEVVTDSFTPRNAASQVHTCDGDAAIDAGAPDSAPPLDAGAPDSGEPPIDAGAPDSGEPIDAGPAPDAGGGEDAGPETDASTDGGPGPVDGSTDAGNPTDAGPALPGTGVVISQVYVNGGFTGATYKVDFVELFNRSDSAVSLAGLSVQYGSAAGNFGNNAFSLAVLPDVSLPKGKYFLVAFAGNDGGVGASLPAPDAVGTANLSASNGKVALARTTVSLGCGGTARCSPANIVDMVGYGGDTVTDWEGSGRAAVPGAPDVAKKATLRNGQGCVDTDDNPTNFAVGPVTPRNTQTAAIDCSSVDAGTSTDAGSKDSGIADSGPRVDSGTPPRNDGGGGGNGVESDSGCSCRAAGTSGPNDQRIAFGVLGALGLVVTARRRRARVAS